MPRDSDAVHWKIYVPPNSKRHGSNPALIPIGTGCALGVSARNSSYVTRGRVAKRTNKVYRSDGAPVFLLRDSSDARYNPAINFRHLSAEFHTTCRVQSDGESVEGQFCLVWCDGSSPELHELFVRCVAAAIEELPEVSATRDLESCILRLRNLFRALASPCAREIAGLWAELFVILKSGNPTLALTLWHADQFDRFDFSSDYFRLEVKSTVKSIRAHEFSLEQLQSSTSGIGLVASVMLQPLTGGVSVLDLARTIEAEVVGSTGLKQKLWENVAATLGVDFSERLDKRFDLSYAERWFAMYAMDDVPRLDNPVDPRVTSIRFVSDLTDVTSDRSFAMLTAALSNSKKRDGASV